MIYFLILYTVLVILIYILAVKKVIKLPQIKGGLVLGIIFVTGFALRLILAKSIEGMPNDIASFKAWAVAAADNFSGLYKSGMFLDYPPLYMYVLFIIGKLAAIPSLGADFTLLIKLPSILADMATAYLLCKLTETKFKSGFGYLTAAIFIFNPAIILNSSIWGMVDSFFMLFVIAALLLVVYDKVEYSVIFFAASILMKPQGIFFLPVLFFEVIRKRSIKRLTLTILFGFVTTIVIILPFFSIKDPLWIFKLYLNTASEYPYATLNAYNLFGLLGANLKQDSGILFIFSYNTWGLLFDVLVFLFAGFIYLRFKNAAAPLLAALILNTGAFTLSTRMHERYMYPAIVISLLLFIYIKDRRLPFIFTALTFTITLNMHDVLYRALNTITPHIPPDSPLLIWSSIANVILLIYMVILSVRLLNQKNEARKESNIKKSTQSQPLYSKMKLDKNDFIIMAVMTAIYLVIALLNLGSLKAPETSWTPAQQGENIIVDLGKEINTGRIYYYAGLGQSRPGEGKYRIEYKDSSGRYLPLAAIDKNSGNIFVWKYAITPDIKARYLKIVADAPTGTLNEIVFFERNSIKPLEGIKIIEKNTDAQDEGSVENLFDEADKVDYKHTYYSGMIFDEIYHARTAYEYINQMQIYEWTHPPLGKLLISIGIAVFGMVPFGWRIVGALFGTAMIPIMYLFGRKMFDKKFYAFCTAFLMMFDFMHFGLTRIATIDVYGTFFVILMYYFIYDYFANKSYLLGFKQSLKPLFLSGLFFGLGAASKWIGLYAGGGLALLFFSSKYTECMDYKRMPSQARKKTPWFKDFIPLYLKRTILYCVLFFIVIPAAIYIISYIPGIITGSYPDFGYIFQNQAAMLKYHSKDVLTATHPFSSFWWEWPLMTRPLETYAGTDLPAGISSTMTIMGNPAIWWIGILAVAASVLIAVRKHDRKMTVVFAAFAFQYLPWVGVTRIAFIYHFFSSVPFVILCIVYVIKELTEDHPKFKPVVYTYLAVVLLLFIMFYPVLSGMEVSRNYVEHFLLWFKGRWIF